MSQTFERIQDLIEDGEVLISAHGYDELAQDNLLAWEVLASVSGATVVEDYPNYGKGPCAFVLQTDRYGNPVHVVWGIPKGKSSPAVLVTAYRPDPDLWHAGFIRRKK